jgi:ABC-type transport system substrate-binding protein
VAVAILCLVLAACEITGEAPPPDTGAPSPSPVAGGSLLFGVYGEPATLDPHSPLASDLTYALVRPLYRSLYRFEPDGEAVPDLVRSLGISGDVATLTLERAKWSDGRPITARDVAGTVERARPPSGLSLVDSVDVITPRRLVLTGSVEDWPATLARISYVVPPSGRPLYSGPFVLARSVPGLQMTYRPNLGSGASPYLDRFTVQFTESVGILLGLLEQGDVDAAWIPSSVNLEQRLDEIGLAHDDALGWERLYLDLEGSSLDVEQRRALARSLDRRAFETGFVREDGRIANTLTPEPGPGAADGPFSSVFRGEGEGEDVSLQLAAPTGDELLDLLQRLSQVHLDLAGFDVELVNVDARRFYGEWARDDPVDAALRRAAGAPGLAPGSSGDLAALPLFHVENVLAWREGVFGLDVNPTLEGPLWNAETWFRSRGGQ